MEAQETHEGGRKNGDVFHKCVDFLLFFKRLDARPPQRTGRGRPSQAMP
jgi:hypothetical protein